MTMMTRIVGQNFFDYMCVCVCVCLPSVLVLSVDGQSARCESC